MYDSSFRLRGKTYDYKIQYEAIKKFMVLPKPDEMHFMLCIGLDPPLRQVQTRYPFVVMQFKRDEEVNLDWETIDTNLVDVHLPDDDPLLSFDLESTTKNMRSVVIKKKHSCDMQESDLEACFNLIAKTSATDYKASAEGWKPRAKRREMKLRHLKYLLVRDAVVHGSEGMRGAGVNEVNVRGFISFMPTYEDGKPVAMKRGVRENMFRLI